MVPESRLAVNTVIFIVNVVQRFPLSLSADVVHFDCSDWINFVLFLNYDRHFQLIFVVC